MRALAGLFAVVLALGIVACGGAGNPPVQVGPTISPSPAASGAPAASPAASPAGTADPDAQDDYGY